MPATLINAALVLLGSAIGLIFKNRINEKLTQRITCVLGLVVMVIGISGAVETENVLCMIVCLVLGTLLGEWMKIEDRLDSAGELLRRRFAKSGETRFTEGFVSATVLFCVGSMAIMGSLEAGINNDYTLLISKGVIDGVTSITFAAAMGIGVIFSVVPMCIYQGGLTALAVVAAPYLSDAVVTEISAVGSVIIIGIAINMLELAPQKLKVGNMLPSVFLPLIYIPLVNWLSGLL